MMTVRASIRGDEELRRREPRREVVITKGIDFRDRSYEVSDTVILDYQPATRKSVFKRWEK